MIFTRNREDDNIEYDKSQNKNKIGSVISNTFKRLIYAVGLLILGIVIYRFISTATPGELKNYIIKSDMIENAYSDSISAKKDFLIYKLELRNPFSLGDALFIENAYYLENVENLQLTMRCKNAELAQLILSSPGVVGDHGENDSAFKYYLKVTDTSTDVVEEPSEIDISAGLNYALLEPVNESSFGNDKERYSYNTLSFDGVKIDYANTKVELYVFMTIDITETGFDEEKTLARFTIFDINMPKTKLNAKKFKIDADTDK